MEGPADSLPRLANTGCEIDPVIARFIYCRAIESPVP